MKNIIWAKEYRMAKNLKPGHIDLCHSASHDAAEENTRISHPDRGGSGMVTGESSRVENFVEIKMPFNFTCWEKDRCL
jgi:hypothetical protein